MQAIGLIETYGLIAAIESADVMLKAAQVELLERSLTGGGLVTVMVTGDVGAVKSAVDAAAAAIYRLNDTALISQHVIARSQDEIEKLISPRDTGEPKQPVNERKPDIKEDITEETKKETEKIRKDSLDLIIQNQGLDEGIKHLETVSLSDLRKLAKEYQLGIAGNAVVKSGKETLMKELQMYYQQLQKSN